MTGEEFIKWQEGMALQSPDRVRLFIGRQADCAKLLGVDRTTMRRWEKEGPPHIVELACMALRAKLDQPQDA
jgi:hypothetical protein